DKALAVAYPCCPVGHPASPLRLFFPPFLLQFLSDEAAVVHCLGGLHIKGRVPRDLVDCLEYFLVLLCAQIILSVCPADVDKEEEAPHSGAEVFRQSCYLPQFVPISARNCGLKLCLEPDALRMPQRFHCAIEGTGDAAEAVVR